MKKFSIVLPDSWHMLSLRGDIATQVQGFAQRRLAGVPERLAVLARPRLIQSLTRVATNLAEGGAVGLAVALEAPDGLTGSPSVVFLPLAVPEGQEPLDVLLAVASQDPSAEAVDVGNLVSIRLWSTEDATSSVTEGLHQAADLTGMETGSDVASLTARRHRVRYLMGDPGDTERWIDVAFSVTSTSLPHSEEIAAALIELFDASIQSFRWLS